MASLKREGLHPKFHLLDLDNEETIVKMRDFMLETYGGIDVLVNNAGVLKPVPPQCLLVIKQQLLWPLTTGEHREFVRFCSQSYNQEQEL